MTDETIPSVQTSINECIHQLEERHRMHRKIRFLLDIRGLLVINKIQGDYVEFGVYRGEMMYAATQVIGHLIDRFIGLDTFTGLPQPQKKDAEAFVFEQPGFMASPKSFADTLLQNSKHHLIEGDFRTEATREALNALKPKIAVLSIDCNWPSSVEASFELARHSLQPGSIIFLDDYFVALRQPNFHEALLQKACAEHGLKPTYFQTYPPCARAFICEKA